MAQAWRPKRPDSIYLALAIVLCLWFSSISHAQAAHSEKVKVEGRVVDQQGLPVPSATVILNNELSGITNSRNASSAGLFSFAEVEPGVPRSWAIL